MARIYNCHTHIFTMDHVPKWYLFGAARIPTFLQKPLFKMLRWWPGTNDQLDRLSAFATAGYNRSQYDVFAKHLKTQYPDDTAFVVLPMDMACMSYGPPEQDINRQHEDLAAACLAVKADPNYEGELIPFVHIDPRRRGALPFIRYWIEERGFKGVKIYPPLGYRPDDPCLDPIFAYCSVKKIPIMTHASGATVRHRKYLFKKDEAAKLASPKGYLPVLEKYPDLRICFGHFGGDRSWLAYRQNPFFIKKNKAEPTATWQKDIRELMKRFRGVYADLSYVIFSDLTNLKVLKVLLQDSVVLQRTLFGSDFYMVLQEETSEKEMSFRLRADLTPDAYRAISHTNPMKFLGGARNLNRPVMPRESGKNAAPDPGPCSHCE